MNVNLPPHANDSPAVMLERDALQVVLQWLAVLLPAVAFWTWRAPHLGSPAQSSAIGLLTVLITLGVIGLLVLQRRGLTNRICASLLGAGLLAWALAVVVWGGTEKLELLLPFLGAVAAAMLGGLAASSRALAATRLALAEAQAALREPDRRELENLFSKAFELSPLGMSLSRASDGVFLALNAATEKIQGYRPEELLGRSALELGLWEHSTTRESFLQQVRDLDGRFEVERRLRHKDGSWVHCRVWASLVEVDGQTCLLCAAVDVTPQKHRESLLIDLAEGLASPLGEPFLRSAARYLAKAISADLVMVAEIGVDARLTTLAVWKDRAHVPDISFKSAQAPFSAVLNSTDLVLQDAPDGMPSPDCPGLFRETEDIYRACAGLALRDADGTPIGLLCAWWRTPRIPETTGEQFSLFRIVASRSTAELVRLRRDREILQLKGSLEHRVQARTEQLRATNAELESFAYSVSHDLQSPLRSIQGFLFLLERRLKPRLSGEESRLVERINVNVMRMHELINDLLALARVSRGHLVRESVDLSAIAEHIAADLQLATPKAQVRLTIAPGLRTHCDAKLARIVLENVLGNAWKYTRKVAVAHIEFGALPAEGDHPAAFFVRDNGAGFNMDYAGSLFKPFHRLHHEDEYEGSGIGLATVHRILERHGGNIWADAVEGLGACFFFTFDDLQGAEEHA